MIQEPPEVKQIFAGNSEMTTLMRGYDWSPTPLDPISGWTSSLKTAFSICLKSCFPMVIWWGKKLVMLYNDAWRPIQGTKHSKALQQVRTLEQVRQIPARSDCLCWRSESTAGYSSWISNASEQAN